MKLNLILLVATLVHFFSNKVLTLNMQEKAKTTLRIKQQKERSGRKM